MHSDTVHAPRNLSSALLARLDEIAEHHAGQVALHGRLFAQWMHHAYPRECPFPHIAGSTEAIGHREFTEKFRLPTSYTKKDLVEVARKAAERAALSDSSS